jgi:hypothetical protein
MNRVATATLRTFLDKLADHLTAPETYPELARETPPWRPAAEPGQA